MTLFTLAMRMLLAGASCAALLCRPDSAQLRPSTDVVGLPEAVQQASPRPRTSSAVPLLLNSRGGMINCEYTAGGFAVQGGEDDVGILFEGTLHEARRTGSSDKSHARSSLRESLNGRGSGIQVIYNS